MCACNPYGLLTNTVATWYTVHFQNTYSGVTVSFQVHCEPKHLSLREIKLAHYLISSYSGTRTVEVHLAAHANPAYRSSNTGQKLQHTLTYNPHKYLAIHMCINMCVTEREKEKVRERTFFLCHNSSGLLAL